MKRAMFFARSFEFNTNPNHPFVKFTSFTRPRLRFYSSESDSSKLFQTQNNNGSFDAEDVTNQELKRRIEKYLEGDEDAIPSIFEAILKRKLAGKHDQSDDELMEELQIRPKNTSDTLKDDDEGDDEEDDAFDSESD